MNTTIIVGDGLTGFGTLDNVVHYSEAIQNIERGLLPDEYFQLGQGLSKESIAYIDNLLLRSGQSDRLLSKDVVNAKYASKKESHKHKSENILITSPKKVDEDHYDMMLVVDERGELLLDHITGFHIQGMVLIEAARQAFLAVTEKYFYENDIPSAHYFVINKMDTAYHAFVFAIDIDIRYCITEKKIEPHRSKFSADVEFWQNETLCTTVKVAFSVYEAQKLEQKEKALAQLALNQFVQKQQPERFNQAV